MKSVTYHYSESLLTKCGVLEQAHLHASLDKLHLNYSVLPVSSIHDVNMFSGFLNSGSLFFSDITIQQASNDVSDYLLFSMLSSHYLHHSRFRSF